MNEEIWKPVVGYEEFYEVSNLGNVRRVKVAAGAVGNKLLKGSITAKGYRQVYPCVNGKPFAVSVHSWVAEAFLGKRPKGLEVNHKDGNKLNNHIDNLEYVTRGENVSHSYRLGLHIPTTQRGEDVSNAKLTDAKVKEIRTLYALGNVTYKELGVLFNVKESTIANVITRRSWNHVE